MLRGQWTRVAIWRAIVDDAASASRTQSSASTLRSQVAGIFAAYRGARQLQARGVPMMARRPGGTLTHWGAQGMIDVGVRRG
jgi:hypothetical protein